VARVEVKPGDAAFLLFSTNLFSICFLDITSASGKSF
jgi:hypothetical protein